MPHLGFAGTPLPALVMYYGGIVVFLLSCFWKPELGLYFMVPLLPLQTVRYRLHAFPLGSLFVDVMLLGVAIGLWRKGHPIFPKTPLNKIILVFAGLTYVLLWRGTFFINAPLPLWFNDERLSDWKNYMVMPILFLVVTSAITTTKQMKILLVLMCFSVLVVNRSFVGTMAGRDMSAFSYEIRDAGAMGYAGENGLGAFEAQFAIFLLVLCLVGRKILIKIPMLGVLTYCVLALMYSFSRGAYVGFCLGILFVGLLKEKKLLLLLFVFLCTWQVVLPPAVRERVLMTRGADGEIESSAAERLGLWDEAMRTFEGDPLLGTGFNTYGSAEHLGAYRDTHNLYVKVLVEMGLVGVVVFLTMLWKMYVQGYRLFRDSEDPFLSGLGLGFAGLMVTLAVANFFGDRWTYLQISGYTWTLLGFAVRGRMITEAEHEQCEELEDEAEDEQLASIAAH
jgi:O-antigen ligase